MNNLQLWFKQVSMYRLMLYFLLSLLGLSLILSALGVLPYVWWHILATALYLAAVCFIANFILAKLFKTKTNFESQFITALILSCILGPVNPTENLLFLVTAGTAAMASKYVLAYKGKHIFNPAATAALATFFILGEGASWWIGNQYTLPLILLGGIIVVRTIRWFHLVTAFAITYIVLLLTMTRDLTFLLYSAMFFFVFVMLPEPLTAPAGKRNRILYGVFIALALYLMQRFTSIPYSLELALLIGNLAFWTTKNKQKLILQFISKDPIAKNTFAYWFRPIKKFNFIPGQFLEWTIPHEKADSRGIRRWFTIAASPTEDRILLATKQSDNPSSFKKTLNSLTEGQEISVSDPDGEFVLPKNITKKLVLIGGGIGITPYRSIVKNLLDTNQTRDIVFMYSVKTEEELAFKEIWSEAAKKMKLKPVYVVTDKFGYINPDMIYKEVPDWKERMFYVSGPEPMVEAFEKMLAQMGIKQENIVRDYFPGYVETYS